LKRIWLVQDKQTKKSKKFAFAEFKELNVNFKFFKKQNQICFIFFFILAFRDLFRILQEDTL
jgi:hypothetical protein